MAQVGFENETFYRQVSDPFWMTEKYNINLKFENNYERTKDNRFFKSDTSINVKSTKLFKKHKYTSLVSI